MSYKIVISGGGTGGHIYPAIAIADALKAIDSAIQILFVGAEGKMEMEKIPRAGYDIIGLPISGFQRKFTYKNLLFPIRLLRSMMKARQIVNTFDPILAIGVGGYASGPLLRAAASKGRKTVIQEQNSYPGITNKILSRSADKICVAYDGMERFFPAEKIVLTGNPVRNDIRDLTNKRNLACANFGLAPEKKTILLIGGSLGARTLNRSMMLALSAIEEAQDIQWLWQCGKIYYDEYKDSQIAKLSNVKLLPFIEKMDEAYAVGDLVISRAGALSISEICVAAKASILVPSPNVAEDHQTKNAQALVIHQATRLIIDSDAPDQLVISAIALVREDQSLKSLGDNAGKIGRPDAARDIANVVISILNNSKAA